jgi:hypothetical protein
VTKRAKASFTVNQYASSHQSWIAIELDGEEDGMTRDLFGFDLKPGTTFERAKQIAQFMNENLEEFTFINMTPDSDRR